MHGNEITEIQEFIEELKAVTDGASYMEVLLRLKIPRKAWETQYHWDRTHYKRVILYQDEQLEVLLACWESGQESNIHDYANCKAWIHPISGKVREEKFVKTEDGSLRMAGRNLLDTNDFSFMEGTSNIHRFKNPCRERAVTLHIYHPSVKEWTIYDINKGELSTVAEP